MSEVNVSKDALAKVKTALNEYHIDISGFSTRVEQHSSDISKSAELEMQKIAKKIEETINEVNGLRAKIDQIVQAVNQMSNEIKSQGQNLEITQNQLTARQNEVSHLRKQIAELKRVASEAEGEAKERIQAHINQLHCQLSQVESDIISFQNKESELKERISQLQRKISEVQAERIKKEDELRTTERLLDRLRNKQERMNVVFARVNDTMDTMLSASKSFETQAVSKTEQSVGNIEKCIVAIDAYLG